MGHLLKSRFVDNFETLLNIIFENVLYQRTHIALFVFTDQQLRKTTLSEVFVEGSTPEAFSLGGPPVDIYFFHYTELLEGERIERNLLVAPGQESCQVAA